LKWANLLYTYSYQDVTLITSVRFKLLAQNDLKYSDSTMKNEKIAGYFEFFIGRRWVFSVEIA
jgi:hypothetical protein